eukprot:scaffold609_cov170-Amphora_coffeaeformis.AAC.47
MMEYCQRHRRDLLPSLAQAIVELQYERNERIFITFVMRQVSKSWGIPVLAQIYRAASAMLPPNVTIGKDETTSLTNRPKTNLEKSVIPVSIDLTIDEGDETGETNKLDTRRQPVVAPVSIDLTGNDVDDNEANESDTRQPSKAAQNCVKAGPVTKVQDKNALVPFDILAAAAAGATPVCVVEEEAPPPNLIPTKVAPDQLELAIAYGFDLARRLSLSNSSSRDEQGSHPSWELAAQTIRSMSDGDRLRVWKHLSKQEPGKRTRYS